MKFFIDGTSISIDILTAQRQLERIENEVDLKGRSPTMALLKAIGGWLEELGVQASLSACWAFWWSVAEITYRAGKQSEPMAELAYWFGINPFTLTEMQQVELMSNLPRVQAQQTLHAGRFDKTDYEGVYQLVLLATGNEKFAQKAKADALERFVDARVGKGSSRG